MVLEALFAIKSTKKQLRGSTVFGPKSFFGLRVCLSKVRGFVDHFMVTFEISRVKNLGF